MPTTRVKLYLMGRAVRNFSVIRRHIGLKRALSNVFYSFSTKYALKHVAYKGVK